MKKQFSLWLKNKILKRLKIICSPSGKNMNSASVIHIIDATELNQLMKNFQRK